MYRYGYTFTYNAVMCMYLSIDSGGCSLLLNQSTRHETCVYKNNFAVIHLLRHDDELLYGIWSTRSRYMRHRY